MKRIALMLTLAAALPILSACARTTAGAGTEATCAQWRPITWSQHDTAGTIADVKGNNARREAWCTGRRPVAQTGG